MPERRNNERRKWGRKVIYPFINSDGVLVTKNQRRLIDRRLESADATDIEASSLGKPAPSTLSEPKTSLAISATKVMELEGALQEDKGATLKIDTSIKDLEFKILNIEGSEPNSKVSAAAPSRNKMRPQAKKQNAQPADKLVPTTEAKPATKNDNVSIEISFKGNKHRLSEKQDPFQIGRDSACDIIIQGTHVSRAHAKIIYKDGKFFLHDHSFNGTYINFDNGQKMHVTKNKQTLISDGVMSMGKPVHKDSKSIIQFNIVQ